MHTSFTENKPSSFGLSCKNIMEYLEKENYNREKIFEETLNLLEESQKHDFDEQIEQQNKFFSNRENDKEKFFEIQDATDEIDNNISSRHKKDSSAFFVLNISPSKDELEHLRDLANEKIDAQFSKQEQNILEDSEIGRTQLKIMRNDLMHQILREYGREVMKNYAENFDRVVYNNPDNLPNQKEEKEINVYVKNELVKLNLEKGSDDYSKKYQELRELKAKEMGRDLSVRKMTEKDLVWFGKVEEKRTYKGNDKWVIENKKIHKEIEKIEKSDNPNLKKIEELSKKLNRDRETGEIVKEGMLKGGQQYHLHIVVSRYDNCPNKRFKGSISPKANHKNGKVADTNSSVGFDRNKFFSKNEKTFDYQFGYNREPQNSYENFNKQKKEKKELLKEEEKEKKSKDFSKIKSIATNLMQPIKSEVLKNSGIQEINKLDVRSTIRKELGFSIPLNLPKTPVDAGVKLIKTAIQKITETSAGY